MRSPARSASRVLSLLPAVLAFALLLLQVVLPWTMPHFLSQDGPSHLYNAIVARSLLFDPQSPYRSVYALQSGFIPNCGTSILFATSAALFGTGHAEQALSSILVLTGFFAFAYALRSLQPGRSVWLPLANCLFNVYFLYKGFYNFYLGMALMLFLIGYYIRHARGFTARRSVLFGAGAAALFFVHLIPAALTLLAAGLLGLWIHLIEPLSEKRPDAFRSAGRSLFTLGLAMLPAAALILEFVANSSGTPGDSEAALAWHEFPRWLFAVSANRIGRQELLYPALLLYIVTGILVLRRREWLTPRGGLALVTLVCFGMYIFVPDTGYGGSEAKVRFAWTCFLFGGLVAASAARLRGIRTAVTCYLGLLLIGTLVTYQAISARLSDLSGEYLAALKVIPAHATFVRMRYPIPKARHRHDIPNDAPADPLYHIEGLWAARQQALDLSDYQPLAGIFPVRVLPAIPAPVQSRLWEIEDVHTTGAAALKDVIDGLPLKLDYVVILGEASETPDLRDALTFLQSRRWQLASTAGPEPFLRIYRHP